jgi:arylsulfatase A-like enzyme
MFAAHASAQQQQNQTSLLFMRMIWAGTSFPAYGNTKIKTPNIDALAAQGVRFTQAYATAPICSPSRMGLLTGRYQQRFGGEFLVPELYPPVLPDHLKQKIRQEQIARKSMFDNVDTVAYNKIRKGIPLSEKLIAQFMKEQGYATGAIGKWHAGEADSLQPWKRGFDYYYGTLTWGTIYASVKDPGILTKAYYFHTMNSEDTARHGSIQIVRNGVVVNEKEYITDRFYRRSFEFY